MRALDDVVRAGKVLCVGVSNFPAWKVAEGNTLAALRGWTAFCALQIEYSLIQRDVERELVPMARDLGLGITPWAPLAGGVLTGKYAPEGQEAGGAGPESKRREVAMNDHRLGDRSAAIVREVLAVARETGRTPAQVAIRWCMDRPGVASPILGARTAKQLEDNLGSLDVPLDGGQRERLDRVSAVDLGWPHTFLSGEGVQEILHGGTRVDPAQR